MKMEIKIFKKGNFLLIYLTRPHIYKLYIISNGSNKYMYVNNLLTN